MKYEIFKDIVTREFFKYAGLDSTKVKQVNHTVAKHNMISDAITFCHITDNEGPTIYINDMYDNYLQCQNLQKVFAESADMINNWLKLTIDTSEILTKEYILSHVVLNLINRECNSELLNSHPYREFLDLVMVYRVVVSETPFMSYLVTHGLLAVLDIDENTLYEAANRNTEYLCSIYSLTEEVQKYVKESVDDGFSLSVDSEQDFPFYIVTNMNSTYGAISIIYSSVTKMIQKLINCDEFIIIPSNLHECICAPYDPECPVELLQAEHLEMNYSITHPKERLSNSIYIFKNGKISILSTSNKELIRPEEVSK